jgi:hypothetical protein
VKKLIVHGSGGDSRFSFSLQGNNITRFKEEVEGLMRLSHPHLAPVLGGCNMGAQYLIWDYIPGHSLFEYLKRYLKKSKYAP